MIVLNFYFNRHVGHVCNAIDLLDCVFYTKFTVGFILYVGTLALLGVLIKMKCKRIKFNCV